MKLRKIFTMQRIWKAIVIISTILLILTSVLPLLFT